MKILFELSGEHPSLPAAEARACLSAYGVDFDEIKQKNVLIVDAEADRDKIRDIAGRLALSYSVNEVLTSGSLSEIESKIDEVELGAGKTFGIKGKKFEGGESISLLKNRIGEAIKRSRNLVVELGNPDIEVAVFADKKIYLCKIIAHVDRKKFEKRKSHYRPFSSPISIHPRVAMALVNLSGIMPGETLLDPFCGTGGILIEAGMMGAKLIGVDIKKNIVEGCRTNLEYYGMGDFILHTADATGVNISPVDAIVTDFPYGRSTYVGADMEGLYEKAFAKMKDWLKDGKRAVVGLPDRRFIELGSKYLHLEEVYPMRVHRSLTRYFCVYRNI